MIELSVCIGSACHLRGSYNVIQVFQQMIEDRSLHDAIDFKASFCMKQCQGKGVSVSVNGVKSRILPEAAREYFQTSIVPMLE